MTPMGCDQAESESRKRLDADDTCALKVRCKIWLENDDGMPVIGEGRLRILQAVRRTGSISKASKALKQPFRNVWGKIKDAERQCGFRLVETTKSGSKLTSAGERLIFKYAELARSCSRSANDKFRRLFAGED
jgi:molybdate transport system regulatory protein